MLKRFIIFIEQEPWDQVMMRQERRLNRACVLVIFLAAVYFGPVLLNILTR